MNATSTLNMSKCSSMIIQVILKELSITRLLVTHPLATPMCSTSHSFYHSSFLLPNSTFCHIGCHEPTRAHAKHRHQLRSCATLLQLTATRLSRCPLRFYLLRNTQAKLSTPHEQPSYNTIQYIFSSLGSALQRESLDSTVQLTKVYI